MQIRAAERAAEGVRQQRRVSVQVEFLQGLGSALNVDESAILKALASIIASAFVETSGIG